MTELEPKAAPMGATPVKTTVASGLIQRDRQAAEALAKRHHWLVTGTIVCACALLVAGLMLLLRS